MSSDTFLLKPGETWVMLGDSITQDPGGYATLCALAIRERFPGYELKFVNAGVGGNKARDMVARFERDVLAYQPDLVSISVGVNDVWHGFYDFERFTELETYDPRFGEELNEYRKDLEWMASILAERGVRTVFVSPTMIGEQRVTRENRLLANYISEMRQVAQEFNATYCPMNEAVWKYLEEARRLQPDAALTTDGVHMTREGAEAMAATLLQTLGFPSPEPAPPK